MGPRTRTLTPVPGLACTPRVGSVRPGGGPGRSWGPVEMSPSNSELLPHRLPQLPLLRTVCGPGPRGGHPQRPGSHQHCVSKGAGLGGVRQAWICTLAVQPWASAWPLWASAYVGAWAYPTARVKGGDVWDAPRRAPQLVSLSFSWRGQTTGRGKPWGSGGSAQREHGLAQGAGGVGSQGRWN